MSAALHVSALRLAEPVADASGRSASGDATPAYADTAAYWFQRGQHRRVEATARHALADAEVNEASRSLVSELAGLASLRDGLSDRALFFLREAARTGTTRSPAARANLHRSLAIALLRSGHVDEADAAIRGSLEALENADADADAEIDPALRLDVHYTASVTALRRAWPLPTSAAAATQPLASASLVASGRRHLDRADALLATLNDPAARRKHAELQSVRAGYVALDGHAAKALSLAERAAAHAGDPRTRIRTLEMEALVALHAGRTGRAQTAVDAALKIAREHPSFVPRLLVLSVDVASASGDTEAARRALSDLSTADAAVSSPLLRRAATSYTAGMSPPPVPVLPWVLVGIGLAAGLFVYAWSRAVPSIPPSLPFPSPKPDADAPRDAPASTDADASSAAQAQDPSADAGPNPQPDSNCSLDADLDADLEADLTADLGGDGSMQREPGVPGLTISHPGAAARSDASSPGGKRPRWPFGVAHPDYAETPLGGSPMQPTVRPPQSALFASSGHALPAYDPSGTYLGLKHMPQQLVDEMVAGRFYVLDLGDRFGVIYRVMHGTREIVRRDASSLCVASAPFECHGLPVYWLRPARH